MSKILPKKMRHTQQQNICMQSKYNYFHLIFLLEYCKTIVDIIEKIYVFNIVNIAAAAVCTASTLSELKCFFFISILSF